MVVFKVNMEFALLLREKAYEDKCSQWVVQQFIYEMTGTQAGFQNKEAL